MMKTYLFLQCITILLGIWAFNLYRNCFCADQGGSGLLVHGQGQDTWTFDGGVCLLGKIGIWLLFGWYLIRTILLFVNKEKKDMRRIGIANGVIIAVIALLSLMNLNLFVRSVPLYTIEVLMTLMLCL